MSDNDTVKLPVGKNPPTLPPNVRPENQPKFLAYLHIRDMATDASVKSIGLTSLAERYVEKVIAGIMRNMNLDNYYVDDSEVELKAKGMK